MKLNQGSMSIILINEKQKISQNLIKQCSFWEEISKTGFIYSTYKMQSFHLINNQIKERAVLIYSTNTEISDFR